MKLKTILPLVASATAFVTHGEPAADEFRPLDSKHGSSQKPGAGGAPWWDAVPGVDLLSDALGQVSGGFMSHAMDRVLDGFKQAQRFMSQELADFENAFSHDVGLNGDMTEDGNGDRRGSSGHYGDSSRTIYEQIKSSKHTTKIAGLIDKFDDIKELLQDTDHNYTLFVPVDEAFEHLPKHVSDEKPSDEFLKAVLKYHLVPGSFPARRVLASHTLATGLSSHRLGDRPQRLRVGASIFGLRINFYSKVVAVDVAAKNGVMHAVNRLLLPPPTITKSISLNPSIFSTLSLGIEKTGLGEELEAVLTGSSGATVFAPSNKAFRLLGFRANAFLFSDKGKPYLKALLKYHVVVNETLYSDAFYEEKTSGCVPDADAAGGEDGLFHIDLPTLLDDKAIGVDVLRRWGGALVFIRVNGFVRVAVQDGIAKDGVIHLIDRVLVPPHRNTKRSERSGVESDTCTPAAADGDDELTEDELMERLADYVHLDGTGRTSGCGSESAGEL